ncbi:MAG TPA: hypothetical protein VI520_08660 [Anaerolineales bacterium]|nr:hypothetical protein [Anaerolineales bacterium]
MRRWPERSPLHPFLLATYPVLALLASNLGQVRPGIANRALIVSILLGGMTVLGFRALLRDWPRAALLASWGLLLFYSYGHVYNELRSVQVMGTVLGRHRFLLSAWALLGLGGAWLILRRPAAPEWLTAMLNFGLLLAIAIPIGKILLSGVGPVAASTKAGVNAMELTGLQAPADRPPPDIYFIILDAYARADTLRDQFDFDNGAFLDALSEMGFYVAECSQSNYAQTELSLAATLNMQYLSDLIDESIQGEAARAQLWPLIRHSAVRLLLEGLGYRTVAFETGYYWTEWEDADVYLAPQRGLFAGMSAFEGTLLRSTAAWALIDALPVLPPFLQRDLDRSTDAHRDRLLYVLDQLGRTPEIPGPKFVFAHIVSPHRPFVFDAEGNPVDDEYTWTHSNLGLDAYREGYRQQVAYLNSRMVSILRGIVEGSNGQAVIIMQGDHGPEEGSSQDRMRNLDVIHLPGGDSPTLYPSISPVNAMRIALNDALDARLPLAEDISRFSTYEAPFDYSQIASECQ